MDYHQEPSGSSYRPNMDFIHFSQPYQDYTPIRSANLDMNLVEWGDYPTQQSSTQNYPSQDASMGQGSGHGSYHGSMPVEDEDDVEGVITHQTKEALASCYKGEGQSQTT